MFRLAIVACCLAFAAAEAEPFYGHGYSGIGYGLGNYGYSGLSHGGYSTLGHGGYGGYSLGHQYGKREADAEAFYGYSGLSHGYSGLSHGYSGLSHGYSGLTHGYSGLSHGYSGIYGYAAPATSAAVIVRGHGTPATVGVAAPYGYAASGHYRADSVGAVHIAKRSADAEPEADAEAYYGSYGNYGLIRDSFSGLGNHGYSGLSHGGYSLGHRGYSGVSHGYSGIHRGYSALGHGYSNIGHGYGTGYSSYGRGFHG